MMSWWPHHRESILVITFRCLKCQIYYTASGHSRGSCCVIFVPCRVQIDADTAASQSHKTGSRRFDFLPIDLIRAEEHRVCFRVYDLQLLLCCLPRPQPIAATRKMRFYQTRPDALQPSTVLGMRRVVAAYTGVLQHNAIECEASLDLSVRWRPIFVNSMMIQ